MPRRALRHAFTILSALSLLLCVAAGLTLLMHQSGIDATIYRGSFGWDHYAGVAFRGIGVYEVHAYAGPIIVLTLPQWFLYAVTVLASLPPAIWIFERRRWREANARALRGRCLNCGHDLRASPERCPECGTNVTKPA